MFTTTVNIQVNCCGYILVRFSDFPLKEKRKKTGSEELKRKTTLNVMASKVPNYCRICHEVFNEGARCPRVLPCSHSLCSQCISHLIESNNRSCPFCRQNFCASSAHELVMHRNLLEALQYLSISETEQPPRNRQTLSYEILQGEFKKEINQENIAYCKRITAEIQNAIRDNLELRDRLLQANGMISNGLMNKLKEMEMKNMSQIRSLEEGNERLANQLKLISAEENQIIDADGKLEAAVNFATAGTVMDEIQDFTNKLQDLKSRLKDFLSREQVTRQGIGNDIAWLDTNIIAIHALMKASHEREEEVMKEKVEIIASCPDEIDYVIFSNAPEEITVSDLKEMSGPTRRLALTGMLFAVEKIQGRRSYAKITMSEMDDRLYLHHLRGEEFLPQFALLIMYDDVLSLADASSRLVFLELGVTGRSLGKLLIRLTNDSKYSLNFSRLCTGEIGSSYANSSILAVMDEKDDTELVVMGDYERNDGKGGEPVVLCVDWRQEMARDIHERLWVAGSVWVHQKHLSKASQFHILTRDCPGDVFAGCFGMVEEGLSVLTDAILKYRDISVVKILDCGIVLSRSL